MSSKNKIYLLKNLIIFRLGGDTGGFVGGSDGYNLIIFNNSQEFYMIDWRNLLETRFYFFAYLKNSTSSKECQPFQT